MDPWLERFAKTNFHRSADTAHDLKTPLNVAVLNLELLRMRIRKLQEECEDERIEGYARSIEVELRRMARIFDAFFLLSTPPKGDEQPQLVDVLLLCTEAAKTAGYTIIEPKAPFLVLAHEPRIRQAFQMFFEGSGRTLHGDGRSLNVETAGDFTVTIRGEPAAESFELTKLFKFYYTDPLGNPDLSMATARLIAETYGGELKAVQEHDTVSFSLSFPPGE